MKILFLLMAGALALAAQDNPFAGAWHGTLNAGAMKLRIGLNITGAGGSTTATLDSPDQGANGIPIDSITTTASHIRFSIQRAGFSFEGDLKAGIIDGTLTQGGQTLQLSFEKGATKAAARPQHPQPPFPYDAEEVRVTHGSVTLAGTLTRPRTKQKVPAILLITGSGPQDRDETIFEHKPFLVIADFLTRKGYAILRLDDRGTARSTGNYFASGLAEFTEDALAAVAWLKARPEVDPKRIGVLGHSEGGIIGPLAAARSHDIAFVIMLAGPAQPFDELIVEQSVGLMRAEGASESAIDARAQASRAVIAILREESDNAKARPRINAVAAGLKEKNPGVAAQITAETNMVLSPEGRSLLAYSAADTLSKLRCPVLALFGSKDLQVPAASNLRAARAAFGQSPSVTLEVLPDLNHLFQTAKTGAASEYASSEETISTRALEAIAAWLLRNDKPGRGSSRPGL